MIIDTFIIYESIGGSGSTLGDVVGFVTLVCPSPETRESTVATLEVAEKLYLMPRELVHRHESGFLRSTEPANQLVAYIWKFGDGLKVILDTLVEPLYDLHCVGIASQ